MIKQDEIPNIEKRFNKNHNTDESPHPKTKKQKSYYQTPSASVARTYKFDQEFQHKQPGALNGIYNQNNQSFSKSMNNHSAMIYRSTNANDNNDLNFNAARNRINASVSRQNRQRTVQNL